MVDLYDKGCPAKVIAEIDCNHKGDMEIAHEVIMVAAIFCKADVVTFQKRCNKELLTPEEYNAPHPHSENSYGTTDGLHREALEFTVEQHAQLKAWCEESGIVYSTSVWDMASTKEIAGLKPQLIKIPSACNLTFDMLGWLCENYEGQIHLSFGMTSYEEEEKSVSFVEERNRAKDLVSYSCTSGYSVSFEDICLYEITRLREKVESRVGAIGFSGYHLGFAVDSAAMTLGARRIERHFTLDRTWKGTDYAASLAPDGMRRLCRDLRNVYKALRYKSTDILPIEEAQRKKLKRF